MEEEAFAREYSRRRDAFHERIAQRLGQKPVVYYSAYPSDNQELQIDNLNVVAVEGRVKFVTMHNSYWGEGKNYISPIVENPTWLDVAVLADEMIRTTGDYHHSFLESVKNTKKMVDDVSIYEFGMGS